MPNTSLSPPLHTAPGISQQPQLNREEEQLVRLYRSLSEQDREALRCLMFAVNETSRSERPHPKK